MSTRSAQCRMKKLLSIPYCMYAIFDRCSPYAFLSISGNQPKKNLNVSISWIFSLPIKLYFSNQSSLWLGRKDMFNAACQPGNSVRRFYNVVLNNWFFLFFAAEVSFMKNVDMVRECWSLLSFLSSFARKFGQSVLTSERLRVFLEIKFFYTHSMQRASFFTCRCTTPAFKILACTILRLNYSKD